MYIISPYITDIMIEIQTVKHVIQEKSFKKNFVLKEFVKDLLIKKYSI
jgi:hypothetical protein